MRSSFLRHPGLVLTAMLATVALSACSDDEEQEPEVDSMALTVGAQNITISNNGTVTGGPITFTRPATPAISATFRKADGTQDAIAHGGDFQLNATPASGTILSFNRTSAFAGTLTGLAAGSTQLSVSLFHMAEAHDDFGPFNVPVTVN